MSPTKLQHLSGTRASTWHGLCQDAIAPDGQFISFGIQPSFWKWIAIQHLPDLTWRLRQEGNRTANFCSRCKPCTVVCQRYPLKSDWHMLKCKCGIIYVETVLLSWQTNLVGPHWDLLSSPLPPTNPIKTWHAGTQSRHPFLHQVQYTSKPRTHTSSIAIAKFHNNRRHKTATLVWTWHHDLGGWYPRQVGWGSSSRIIALFLRRLEARHPQQMRLMSEVLNMTYLTSPFGTAPVFDKKCSVQRQAKPKSAVVIGKKLDCAPRLFVPVNHRSP
jgi:hypothetical protein